MYLKGQNKVQLQIYYKEQAKIKYGYELIPQKIPKYVMVGDLFHGAGHNQLLLEICFIQNAQIG